MGQFHNNADFKAFEMQLIHKDGITNEQIFEKLLTQVQKDQNVSGKLKVLAPLIPVAKGDYNIVIRWLSQYTINIAFRWLSQYTISNSYLMCIAV